MKTSSPDGLHMRFYIEGLNCTACLWLLEKLPEYCPAANSARLNMSESTIEICRKPGASFAAIAETLNRFGYRPHPLRQSEAASQHQAKERRGDLIRIGIAGAATGNIMILAVSLYGGASGHLGQEFRALAAAITTPVLTYCAWPFYRSAIGSLRSGQPNIDVPIVAALVAGMITSFWALATNRERIYFDSLSMLVFLLLSSRFLLKNLQARQMQSTNLQDELLLSSVHRLRGDGSSEKISSLALRVGDRLKMSANQVVPADGSVESGHGLINTAILTGESDPSAVTAGSLVEAGTRSVDGEWILRVVKPPAQTRLAAILRDTETAAQGKSEFVQLASRVSNWFIGIVFILALGIILYFAGTNPEEGIARALALVIVTCPCVFGIAIPLSMSLAIRGAARRGLIIKNSNAIERLWKVRKLFFDKTGTLTTGEMSVLKADFANAQDLEIVLALEQGQLHPVGRTLTKYLTGQNIQAASMGPVHPRQGGGLWAVFEGQEVSVRPLGMSAQSSLASKKLIRSSFGFFRGEVLCGTFSLGDAPRVEAQELLNWAQSQNFSTQMISGDRSSVVEGCGKSLGLISEECQAELSPEMKSGILKSSGPGTAMIGDGANDAAALASADVGIAVCGSLDVSLRAADVYLVRPHLMAVRDLFRIAALTKKAILRNLLFSASFNVVSGTLAIFGLMNPLTAAILMPLSSLTVLLSAVATSRSFTGSGKAL